MLNLKNKFLTLSGCLFVLSFSQLAISNQSVSRLTLNDSQKLSMGMETALAKQIDVVPSAVYPAQAIIPLQTRRSLSSPLAGQITQLNYVHGPIEKGQVIAEMESPDLLKLQEDFLATLSDLEISEQNLKRAQQLNQSGVSSTKQLQQAGSAVKKLSLKKSQIETNMLLIGMAESSIENLQNSHQLQPANLQIKSPIDGQLFDLEVRLGERVEQNEVIISLGETNPIILVVRVPVETANNIEEGQKVKVFSVGKTGVVKHIDMMVDPMTQSVDIHISVDNNDQKLRAGQLFKISFLTRTKQTTYQVSANAISQYHGKTVVFVKDNEQQELIQVLPIHVVNITDKQLYFVAETKQTSPLNIYVKGSTAIKAAMDAANSDGELGE